MTKLLEQAIEAVRKLSPKRQDELAELLLVASSDKPLHVTDEERRAIDTGLADANAGWFATDEDGLDSCNQHVISCQTIRLR